MKKVIIFTAPSGAGKTTLVHHVLESLNSLMFSISATTRERRTYEYEGEDYYFMSKNSFEQHILAEDFLEYEEVYKNQFYGTLKSEVTRIWSAGKAVIFDVDVRGATAIKNYYGDSALSIFVQPPSLVALQERLKSRKSETDESLRRRLERVAYEMSFADAFDTFVINDDLETAKAEAVKIVQDFLAK